MLKINSLYNNNNLLINIFYCQGYWLFHCYFIYQQVISMEIVLNIGGQEDLLYLDFSRNTVISNLPLKKG